MLHSPDVFANGLPAGFDKQFHWEWVTAAVQRRGITPMDVDGVVEIKNHFLMFETGEPGKTIQTISQGQFAKEGIKDGQARTRRSLLNTGLVTFVYQWGKIIPVEWQYELRDGTISDRMAAGPESILPGGAMFEFVRRWAAWADALGPHAWRGHMIYAAMFTP